MKRPGSVAPRQRELATAEWVEWFNHCRLLENSGDVPPVEAEAAHYAHQKAQRIAERSHR